MYVKHIITVFVASEVTSLPDWHIVITSLTSLNGLETIWNDKASYLHLCIDWLVWLFENKDMRH